MHSAKSHLSPAVFELRSKPQSAARDGQSLKHDMGLLVMFGDGLHHPIGTESSVSSCPGRSRYTLSLRI